MAKVSMPARPPVPKAPAKPVSGQAEGKASTSQAPTEEGTPAASELTGQERDQGAYQRAPVSRLLSGLPPHDQVSEVVRSDQAPTTRRSPLQTRIAQQRRSPTDGARHAGLVAQQASFLTEFRRGLREALAAGPTDGTSAIEAARAMTQAADSVLAAVDVQVVRELGDPPPDPETGRATAYALFGMGSYGREELAPFADLDYGVLIERDTPEMRRWIEAYSRRVQALLLEIDGELGLRPCREMSPSGYFGQAYVDTPAGMAARYAASSDDMGRRAPRDRIFIQTGLAAARPVLSRFDDARLFDAFQRESSEALGPAAPDLQLDSPRWRTILDIKTGLRDPFGVPDPIAGWFDPPPGVEPLPGPPRPQAATFTPVPPGQAIAQGRVNVKHDLLRGVQIAVHMLALLYDLPSANSEEVLTTLKQSGKIDPDLADRLRELVESCQRLRLLNHLDAGSSDDKLKNLDPKTKRALRRMVPVLYRLRQGMERIGRGDPNAFELT